MNMFVKLRKNVNVEYKNMAGFKVKWNWFLNIVQ